MTAAPVDALGSNCEVLPGTLAEAWNRTAPPGLGAQRVALADGWVSVGEQSRWHTTGDSYYDDIQV